MAITISTRAIGRRKPILNDFEVLPPSDLRDDGELLLRDLIEHVVACQARQYNHRQGQMRFDRVLSASAIKRGVLRGKVDPAGRDRDQAVEIDAAIATALQGFEDGLYLVIIDDVERKQLDEPVYLSPASRMVFVRLTFLAGA